MRKIFIEKSRDTLIRCFSFSNSPLTPLGKRKTKKIKIPNNDKILQQNNKEWKNIEKYASGSLHFIFLPLHYRKITLAQQLLWGSLVALRSPIFCSYFAKHLIEANVRRHTFFISSTVESQNWNQETKQDFWFFKEGDKEKLFIFLKTLSWNSICHFFIGLI